MGTSCSSHRKPDHWHPLPLCTVYGPLCTHLPISRSPSSWERGRAGKCRTSVLLCDLRVLGTREMCPSHGSPRPHHMALQAEAHGVKELSGLRQPLGLHL